MGGMGTGWSISGTLLAGVLLYGGIGFLLDRWLGTPKVFTAIGLLVGAGLGIYLVYVKYGKEHPQDQHKEQGKSGDGA